MLTTDLERRIQAFENKCYRRMNGIYIIERERERIKQTNMQVDILTGRHKLLLSTVKRRKLSWFGRVCRHMMLFFVPKIILQGASRWYSSQPKTVKSWKDNIKEWTGPSMSSLLRIADDRGRWAVLSADAYVGVQVVQIE